MPRDGTQIEEGKTGWGAGLTLRLARNADGSDIANLCQMCGFQALEHADWSDIEPYWLVAESDGDIVGALQVLIGKPTGRLEYLAIDPCLGPRERAAVAWELARQGMATLRAGNSKYAAFVIAFENRAFKKVLKRRGAVVLATGNLLIKRL